MSLINKIPQKFSFRTRLFVVMTLILLFAGILILGTTSIQYEAQRENYHLGRLDRKVAQVERHINSIVEKYNLYSQPDSIWSLYEMDFEKINLIHSIHYSLFDAEGNPLFIYHTPLEVIANDYILDDNLRAKIYSSKDATYKEEYQSDIDKFHASYRLLKDPQGTPYGILFFPYFEDVSFSENELNTFLRNLYQIYILLFIGVIFIAYFLSKYVTRSLETIRSRMATTGLEKQNEKIYLKNATREIESLVNSYNKMIDDLAESAEKLARTEREHAWQEMARQVAHEIKNPLTPMRLTVQSFQQMYDPNDPDNNQKLKEFCKLLIQQIDTMTEVAEAFSNFATLPKSKMKTSDLIEVTQLAISIFNQEQIVFSSNEAHIFHDLDRTQWIRVITNLVQNGLQSVPKNRVPQIGIHISKETETTTISITDNGSGISSDLKNKIFEPKFTTKSSGMGLGLGIVKNIIDSHGGLISYVSTPEKGTTFTITLPRN